MAENFGPVKQPVTPAINERMGRRTSDVFQGVSLAATLQWELAAGNSRG